MTLRNTTLTAVAALAVALAGGAMAQDSTPAADLSAPVTSPSQQDSAATAAPEAEAAPAAGADAGDEAETAADPEPVETGTAAPEADSEPEATAGADTAEEPATDQDAAPDAEAEAGADAPDTETEAGSATAETEGAEPAEESAEASETEATDEVTEDSAEESAADTPADEASTEDTPPAEEEIVEELPVTPPHIEDISFSFEGPFGKFDQFQLQRGLQVYTEVCAACHGLRYVPLRTLSDPNGPSLPDDQVKAYAAELMPIMDPETEEERARLTTDHFPTVSGMGMGPDLSLMAKARAGFHGPYGTGVAQLFRGTGGPEYLHAILVSYDGETKDEAGATLYHNTAFDGNWIQMPEPLMDDMVTYEDGTPATVDQMARDVSAFLMWTAEPKLMDRKKVGLISVLFMIVLTALLYLTNKRLWWPIKHRDDRD